MGQTFSKNTTQHPNNKRSASGGDVHHNHGQNEVNQIFDSILTKHRDNSVDDINRLRVLFNSMSVYFSEAIEELSPKDINVECVKLSEAEGERVKKHIEPTDFVCSFKSEAWGGEVIFVIEMRLASMLVSSFFGGDMQVTESKTKINLGEKIACTALCKKIAELLNQHYNIPNKSGLTFKSSFSGMELSQQARIAEFLFNANFEVTFADQVGVIQVFFPQNGFSFFNVMASKLLNEKPARQDVDWQQSLQSEIKEADLTLKAYLSYGKLSLEELANLKVGQMLPLRFDALKNVLVATPNKLVYKGYLGKIAQNLSVKIDKVFGSDYGEQNDHINP